MTRTHSCRQRGVLAGVAAVLTLAPALAFAHAVVSPARSAPGMYERYVLRVPNERDVPTVRVAIRFPARITVVSFAEVAGWTLEVRTGGEERVTGAVWTGELPAGRFVEFPFVAVNPEAPSRLRWEVDQEYGDDVVVSWSGPDGSATPASVTEIASPEPTGRVGVALWVAGAALAAALLALGIALRPRGPAT